MIQVGKVFAEILSGARETNGAIHSVLWTVPGDLPYFNGHFPQNPIFPAVGIVDASTALLGLFTQRPALHLQSIPMAKFLSPITPGQTVRIEWQKESETEWLVEWKDTASARNLATLRLYA